MVTGLALEVWTQAPNLPSKPGHCPCTFFVDRSSGLPQRSDGQDPCSVLQLSNFIELADLQLHSTSSMGDKDDGQALGCYYPWSSLSVDCWGHERGPISSIGTHGTQIGSWQSYSWVRLGESNLQELGVLRNWYYNWAWVWLFSSWSPHHIPYNIWAMWKFSGISSPSWGSFTNT